MLIRSAVRLAIPGAWINEGIAVELQLEDFDLSGRLKERYLPVIVLDLSLPVDREREIVSRMDGKIILLNGASSAGKTTLCKAIRKTVRAPFLHFSLDFFMFDADVIPKERNEPDLGITWKQMRPAVFEGFYRCLPALLSAGNNLLVDTIVENESQRDRLLNLLGPFDVFTVGVHCRLEELRRREAARGNRNPGDAENDFKTVHSFLTYDFEVDSEKSPDENAAEIIRAWSARPKKLG